LDEGYYIPFRKRHYKPDLYAVTKKGKENCAIPVLKKTEGGGGSLRIKQYSFQEFPRSSCGGGGTCHHGKEKKTVLEKEREVRKINPTRKQRSLPFKKKKDPYLAGDRKKRRGGR